MYWSVSDRLYEISSSSSLGDVVPTSPTGMNFDYDIDEVPKNEVPELAKLASTDSWGTNSADGDDLHLQNDDDLYFSTSVKKLNMLF